MSQKNTIEKNLLHENAKHLATDYRKHMFQC